MGSDWANNDPISWFLEEIKGKAEGRGSVGVGCRFAGTSKECEGEQLTAIVGI